MRAEFISNLNRQYMAVVQERMSGYPYRMVLENSISGILPASHAVIDGRNYLYFDITGKLSLESLHGSRAGDRGFFEDLINAVADAQLSLQRYLIRGESLMVLPEQIFFDSRRNCFGFGVWPEGNENYAADMLKLSEFLIAALPGNDRAAAQIVYEFYQACAADRLTPEGLLEITGRKEPDIGQNDSGGQQIIEKEDPFTGFLQADAFGPVPSSGDRIPAEKERKRRKKQKKEPGQEKKTSKPKENVRAPGRRGLKDLIRFLNTDYSELKKQKKKAEDERNEIFFRTLMEKDDQKRSLNRNGNIARSSKMQKQADEEEVGTTLISNSCTDPVPGSAWLIPKDPYGPAPFPIKKELTLIGRVKERCDVVLKNDTVSRIHAKLVRGEDRFELYDEGSVNGTKVNGELLSPGVPFPLLDGDEITFAEEIWSFRLGKDSLETERISRSRT